MPFLSVKIIPRLIHGITSTHNDGCYCVNCLCSLRLEKQLKSYKSMCKNHDHCLVKIYDKQNT